MMLQQTKLGPLNSRFSDLRLDDIQFLTAVIHTRAVFNWARQGFYRNGRTPGDYGKGEILSLLTESSGFSEYDSVLCARISA